MSAFLTRLPIDVESFKKLLPNGSDFESISFDPATNEVQFRWSHRDLVTPFTYHEEFTEAMLKSQTLPKSVKVRERTQIPVNPPIVDALKNLHNDPLTRKTDPAPDPSPGREPQPVVPAPRSRRKKTVDESAAKE